jgi:predicted ArsR family transcriptional regulator
MVKFAEAIQKAHAVVALNFKLPEETRFLAKQIHSQEFDAERTLGRGLELVRDVEKSSGKESIDRVLRKRGSGRREEIREAMTLKNALDKVSVEELGASAMDAVTTELQRG